MRRLALAGAAAVVAGALTFTSQGFPYPRGEEATMRPPGENPASNETAGTGVPAVKFRRAVEGWRHERARADRLAHVLRSAPSVQEALTIASVVYRVSRSELASVAMCESTQRADAVNGRYRGLFQQGPMFEATPFGRAGLSVWSPYAAALSTAFVVSREGWRQWQCRPGGVLAW